MRELTVNEIAQLEERGCWAEDWSDILVEEGFAPSQMENVRTVANAVDSLHECFPHRYMSETERKVAAFYGSGTSK